MVLLPTAGKPGGGSRTGEGPSGSSTSSGPKEASHHSPDAFCCRGVCRDIRLTCSSLLSLPRYQWLQVLQLTHQGSHRLGQEYVGGCGLLLAFSQNWIKPWATGRFPCLQSLRKKWPSPLLHVWFVLICHSSVQLVQFMTDYTPMSFTVFLPAFLSSLHCLVKIKAKKPPNSNKKE